MNLDAMFMVCQPLARCEKKLTISVTQLCTSAPALAGSEIIQTMMTIITTQVKIFVINRFHLLRMAEYLCLRYPRLPK